MIVKGKAAGHESLRGNRVDRGRLSSLYTLLRTGEPAGVTAVVEPALWSRVQVMRAMRRTRTPGRTVKRNYPLRLRCSGCGRYLYGETGRYRHPAPTCDAFIAATPHLRRRYSAAHDKRVQGHSYPQDWYEDAIGELLEQVGGVDEGAITAAVRLYNERPAQVDKVTLARIDRDREELGRRLARNRDVAAWQTGMSRLDGEEQLAREPVQSGRLAPPEVVAYLRSLPKLWTDSGPDGRQALALALFARTEVIGFEQMIYELTPEAIELGLNAALPPVYELRTSIGEFGRGERTWTSDRDGLVGCLSETAQLEPAPEARRAGTRRCCPRLSCRRPWPG